MTAPRFEATPPPPGPRVEGFAGGAFLVGGERFEALLLTPEAAAHWQSPPLAALDAACIEPLLALDPAPEFLLLGTGAVLAFPPSAFIAALEALGIGIEAMDSRAAARTWGVLRGEGRWIAAALMPLEE